MLIIYFLLGLGITTAHSDYGVSFRAQHFDKTVQNIDKEVYIKHQREKRFVTGYFVAQNVTNKPTWRNLNITRNHMPFTGPSTTSRTVQNANQQNFLNNGTIQNNYGNMTDVTGKYVNPGQNYNTNMTRHTYFTYKYIKVTPGYNINGNNTSNTSRYNVPVNSVTPRNTPYPGYPGYPAPNTGFQVPNTGYPAQNTSYPVPNTGYSATNAGYPAQNTGYPAPNTGYSATNAGYPAQNTGYPVANTSYPVPNTGYSATNAGYPAQNTGYPAPNTGYSASGQNYNTTVTRPVYPNNNNTIVRPVNKNNFNNSSPSGYNVQPGNPVTPGNKPYYPVPNTGYPASNTGNLAPNTWYPVPNTVYPVPNTGYPAPNNRYPAPNTIYPPPSFVIPPANVTGFVPKPNPGFTIHDAAPRNNSNGFNNTGNGFNNSGNGFNNTASLANCKCKLPRANSTITKEERTMDACMISCNYCPEGMKMSAFGVCVKDLDYDDDES